MDGVLCGLFWPGSFGQALLARLFWPGSFGQCLIDGALHGRFGQSLGRSMFSMHEDPSYGQCAAKCSLCMGFCIVVW